MPEKTRLRWRSVKHINPLPELPVYEAKVPGGRYRVAPLEYIDARGPYNRFLSSEHGRLPLADCRMLSYEVLFIPDGAETRATDQDLAEALTRAEQAKAIAQRHFNAKGGNGDAEM